MAQALIWQVCLFFVVHLLNLLGRALVWLLSWKNENDVNLKGVFELDVLLFLKGLVIGDQNLACSL